MSGSAKIKELEKKVQDLTYEVNRWRSLYLDQPEDRLYHASDNTWWRRDDSLWTGIGSLVGADPPPGWVEVNKQRTSDARTSLIHAKAAILSSHWLPATIDEIVARFASQPGGGPLARGAILELKEEGRVSVEGNLVRDLSQSQDPRLNEARIEPVLRGPFTCPKCGASHDRGPMNGYNAYRCLRCGETTKVTEATPGYYHPDLATDAEVRADIAEAEEADRAVAQRTTEAPKSELGEACYDGRRVSVDAFLLKELLHCADAYAGQEVRRLGKKVREDARDDVTPRERKNDR